MKKKVDTNGLYVETVYLKLVGEIIISLLGWFPHTCLAKKPQFDINVDRYYFSICLLFILYAFKHGLLKFSNEFNFFGPWSYDNTCTTLELKWILSRRSWPDTSCILGSYGWHFIINSVNKKTCKTQILDAYFEMTNPLDSSPCLKPLMPYNLLVPVIIQ